MKKIMVFLWIAALLVSATYMGAGGGPEGTVFPWKMVSRGGGPRDIMEGTDIRPSPEARVGGNKSGAPAPLPNLETILNRYLEALGGRTALENISSRRMQGKLRYTFQGRETEVSEVAAEVFSQAPNRWRLTLTSDSGRQCMGFDGEQGWQQNADRVLIDKNQRFSTLAFLFNPQAPLFLETYFPSSTLTGSRDINGKTYWEVSAVLRSGATKALFFEKDSGLLGWIGEDLEVPEYIETEGIRHPAGISIYRKHFTADYRFSDIAVNSSTGDEDIHVPTLDEVFPEDFEGMDYPEALPLLIDFPSEHEDMNVPSRDGRFLYEFIVKKGYRRGLEIGTFTGYSALWMGLAFSENGGRLFTIEIEQGPGEEARRNILKAGLSEVVDARIADAFAEIPRIEGTFDFVFIDAWKPDYVKFLRMLRDRITPGGAIVAHNVTNHAREMQDFLQAIKEDPGLETTFNELSAEGMSISIVRK
jgi:predicted O-methyltransferase YrrM